MEVFMPYIWLGVIILMAVLEAVTTQLVSIWFVIGGVVALICSVCGVSIPAQLILFFAVTAITLLITRPLVKKALLVKKVDTNAGRYIGMTGFVTQKVDNQAGEGQVNVSGSIWTARSAEGSILTEGTNVKVEAIEGVKLIVRAIQT